MSVTGLLPMVAPEGASIGPALGPSQLGTTDLAAAPDPDSGDAGPTTSQVQDAQSAALAPAPGPYISDESTGRSDMEESDTNKTKVSDSAYSTSCNSRSQLSSASSKSRSRHSGSSNSSGYGGHVSTLGSATELAQSASKRNKDKKKKTSRSNSALPAPPSERLPEDPEVVGTVCDVLEQLPEDACSNNPVSGSGLGLGPELVFGGCSSPHDNEALQRAAINQTLSFIQKLNSKPDEPVIAIDSNEEKEEMELCSTSAPMDDTTCRTKSSTKSSGKEEFMAIISMSDGIVKYTSSGITDVLGFPHDMWVGRSITDFVQSKDRAAFASHITSGVANPLTQLEKDFGRKTPFFCSLRCYRGLKRSGFGIKEKAVQFRPCQLLLTFREHLNGFSLPEEAQHSDEPSNHGREQPHIYLVVTVNPIKSAYTYPEETRDLLKFGTRLLASTQLSEVDPECVPCLGFLPQDLLGRSVLEFYHPEDMSSMKDVYETVLNKHGVPFLSRPYRFRSQNGGYVLLETEWSSFSNPWSRKLEFIIAQHRVLKGPLNPDVFSAPPENDASLIQSEEILKESKTIQEEIQSMLKEETVSNSAENSKRRVCKVLASLMDSMLEENKISKPDLQLEVPPEEQSFSERDSVMLGEISPHHDYYDSKSSSETPPSYNQLNYNDNIQRFFESKPKTTRSDESGKGKDVSPGKNSPVQDSSLGSGDSGSGGGSGELTGSHDSSTSSSHNSYQQPLLTEALLSKHNETMEKRLVQRHREQRSKGDKRHKPLPGSHATHGVKRNGSHESLKGSKHLHVEPNGGSGPPGNSDVGGGVGTASLGVPVVGSSGASCQGPNANNGSSVWPPFSVTVSPLPPSQPAGTYSSFPVVTPSSHMMPMYCMGLGPQEPRLQGRNPFLPSAYLPTPPSTLQLVYQPYPHSLLYSPLSMLHPAPTMLPTSLFPPGTCVPPESAPSCQTMSQPQARGTAIQSAQHNQQQSQQTAQCSAKPQAPPRQQQKQHQEEHDQRIQHSFNNEGGSHIQCKFQRPPSQATSVKAEPGSALGSIASASRRALSVSSNKNKSLSPLSPDDDKVMEDSNLCSEPLNSRVDEGSYLSSLCSYLCTENSDDSMRSCKDPQHGKGYGCCSQHESASNEGNVAPAVNPRPVRSEPAPWMKNISMTPDKMLCYQIDGKERDDVLNSDRDRLANFEQPAMVNEQLSQLYEDFAREGVCSCLALDEASGSSCEEYTPIRADKDKKRRRSMEYGRLIMIFEAEAPMPDPVTTVAT